MTQPLRNEQHPRAAFLTIDELSGKRQVDFTYRFNFQRKS
jgi:hypothetical protein